MTMKQQLIVELSSFMNTYKTLLLATQDGSNIIVTSTEDGLSISCKLSAIAQVDHQRVSNGIDLLNQRIKDLQEFHGKIIEFQFILKKSNGKLLVKNTLSPKEEVKVEEPKVLIIRLLTTMRLDTLIPIVESDPEFLKNIIQERVKTLPSDEANTILSLINEL